MENNFSQTSVGQGSAGTVFKYAEYDAVVEKMEAIKSKLEEISNRKLTSVDYQSGDAKDALDRKLSEVPASARALVVSLSEMITSMKNVRSNYAAKEASINSALGLK